MQVLSGFVKQTVVQIQATAKRKHALSVIAKEQDFDSWLDLKEACYRAMINVFVDKVTAVFLNPWFVNYDIQI